jgi:hypothetical protein
MALRADTGPRASGECWRLYLEQRTTSPVFALGRRDANPPLAAFFFVRPAGCADSAALREPHSAAASRAQLSTTMSSFPTRFSTLIPTDPE